MFTVIFIPLDATACHPSPFHNHSISYCPHKPSRDCMGHRGLPTNLSINRSGLEIFQASNNIKWDETVLKNFLCLRHLQEINHLYTCISETKGISGITALCNSYNIPWEINVLLSSEKTYASRFITLKSVTSSNYLNLFHLPYVMAFRLASNGNSAECKQVQSMTRKVADVDVWKPRFISMPVVNANHNNVSLIDSGYQI